MKLYHGSTVTVKCPNIQKSRKATDFGKGFYTTTNFEQAEKWAILKRNREHGKKAMVSIYEQDVVTADAAIEMLKTHKLFNQLSFHTVEVIPLLKFTESIEINEKTVLDERVYP